MVKIGCIGELLVEFMCTSKNGHHRQASTYVGPFPSGAPGIFIDQAARCGAETVFVGAVGEDAFGDVVLDRLRADGVGVSMVRRVAGVPTGTAFVSYNDDGSRDFVFNIALSAAACLEADEPTIAALRDAGLDVMHVSGSALGDAAMRARIMSICRVLRGDGVRISFDPNVRKELIGDPAYFAAVKELLAACAIFLPSDDDAAVLFPGRHLEDFAKDLFAVGLEYVALKKGNQGCEAMAGNGAMIRLPAHAVTVVDPTGAGDCFCATFVTLIADGATLEEAAALANAAGALAVTRLGPMEGNAKIADVRRFLRTAER